MEKVMGIYGAGGNGREMLELAQLINQKEKRWSEIVFIDDMKTEPYVNGKRVYTYQNAKDRFKTALEIIMGTGEPETRRKLFEKVKADGMALPALVHPDVYIPESSRIGQGVVIQMGSFISCNVEIGDYVLIQPNVSVCHDDIIEEGCVISGFCNIAGAVRIGKYTYLGLSASVRQRISIGENSIVGMGAVVVGNVEDEMVVMGNPAKAVRRNKDRKVF